MTLCKSLSRMAFSCFCKRMPSEQDEYQETLLQGPLEIPPPNKPATAEEKAPSNLKIQIELPEVKLEEEIDTLKAKTGQIFTFSRVHIALSKQNSLKGRLKSLTKDDLRRMRTKK